MSGIFHLVAIASAGAFLLGRIKLRTALIVGVGALALSGVMPVQTTSGLTTTN